MSHTKVAVCKLQTLDHSCIVDQVKVGGGGLCCKVTSKYFLQGPRYLKLLKSHQNNDLESVTMYTDPQMPSIP